MTKKADLHIHTNYSDSTSTPEEVIQGALEQNLSCIAITDHDITDGIEPARQAGAKVGIEVLTGVELSTQFQKNDIHILGYGFDMMDDALQNHIHDCQHSRIGRMRQMVERVNQLTKSDITLDEVCVLTKADAVGRPHLAQIMLEKGVVSRMQEAFDKYLADGKPACVEKLSLTPFEGIQMIKEAGGVAVLAHPYVTQVDEIIPKMVESGLGGLEVFYPRTTHQERAFYLKLADKHKLLVTGGSDAHGDAKKHTWVGHVQIPYAYVEQLKEACHG